MACRVLASQAHNGALAGVRPWGGGARTRQTASGPRKSPSTNQNCTYRRQCHSEQLPVSGRLLGDAFVGRAAGSRVGRRVCLPPRPGNGVRQLRCPEAPIPMDIGIGTRLGSRSPPRAPGSVRPCAHPRCLGVSIIRHPRACPSGLPDCRRPASAGRASRPFRSCRNGPIGPAMH